MVASVGVIGAIGAAEGVGTDDTGGAAVATTGAGGDDGDCVDAADVGAVAVVGAGDEDNAVAAGGDGVSDTAVAAREAVGATDGVASTAGGVSTGGTITTGGAVGTPKRGRMIGIAIGMRSAPALGVAIAPGGAMGGRTTGMDDGSGLPKEEGGSVATGTPAVLNDPAANRAWTVAAFGVDTNPGVAVALTALADGAVVATTGAPVAAVDVTEDASPRPKIR